MERLKSIWLNMKQRCDNTKRPDYQYYGGKGIKYCDEWTNSKEFYLWAMSNGYKDNLTLERKNIEENYCPENCIWITFAEQRLNTSQSRKITINRKTQCLKSWCEEYEVNYQTVYMRIKRGMNEVDALNYQNKRKVS
jgi:hypothetical protein